MQTNPETPTKNRIGFHYYPDTDHYTANDLNQWLPFLEEKKACWLILRSETSRAIPEQFIASLVSRRINPIIQFLIKLPDSPSAIDLKPILQAYSSWGVEYIVLFDRPNSRESWSSSGWSQANLVESFLDHFIPIANECLSAGLKVVFPPLEPGGNYWDVSFLRNCLLSLQRRNQKNLLNHLILSAYACTYGHSIEWGKGGPEQWSGNKPYSTPADSQDQIGFRNFEWLLDTAQSACNKIFPVILFAAGQKSTTLDEFSSPEELEETIKNIDELFASPNKEDSSIEKVISTNYRLLYTGDNSPSFHSALTKVDAAESLVADPFQKSIEEKRTSSQQIQFKESNVKSVEPQGHPIRHYLLLPAYEWGVSDWHLDVIKPFVRKYQPTIGFSIAEALMAEKVTVIGGEQSFSEAVLMNLRSSGCLVDRISGDGTSIATQLSER